MPLPSKFKGPQRLKFRLAEEAEFDLTDRPPGFIAGWALTGSVPCYKTTIAADAFDESIAKRGLGGPSGVKLYIDHDRSKVGGIIEVLEKRDLGYWIEAQLDLGISYANDFYRASKINGGLNFSVGFMPEELECNEETGWLHISKGDLFEVSGVTEPADPNAQMTIVHSAPIGADDTELQTVAEFEKHLVSNGLAPSRRVAHRIAQAAKASGQLFARPQSAPAADEAPDTPPMLANDLANRLSDRLDKIVGRLSRS